MQIRTGRRRSGARTARRILAVTSAVLAALALSQATALADPGPAGEAADGLADLPAVLPVVDCAAVAELDLTGVTDGPVTITSAAPIDAGTPVGNSRDPFAVTAPACHVTGVIGPGAAVFELVLPTQGWTQRYLQVGCGGLCGSITLDPPMAGTCRPVTDGTIAMAATDMGHQGQNDGTWAADNPQAILDFAYRAQHALAQVAKAVIGEFYGQAPAYSYFDGCSDGGREALMEAQRYPDDFDGIAAGAPANDIVVQNTYHHAWNVLANRDADGRFILLAGKLPLIHQAVLDACDDADGVVDGILDDPRACDFDPATLLCPSEQADASACLTQAEVDVVRRLHDGPVDAEGRHLEQPIAHEWGSELGWSLFVPETAEGPSASEMFALPFLRYLAFQNQQDPNYQLADLQFTVDYFWQVVQSSAYLAATDPDLTRFARSGGKLLLWHGWEDEHITPQSTLDYYRHVREYMGAEQADRFAKLYVFPGVAHCGGGTGANTFDVLTPLMAWTETRTPPEEIIASRVDDDGTVTRTRPVYPYPAVARYDGSGSTDDAANFVPYTPPTEPAVGYDWVGEALYSHGYQASCHVINGQLVCDQDEPIGPRT